MAEAQRRVAQELCEVILEEDDILEIAKEVKEMVVIDRPLPKAPEPTRTPAKVHWDFVLEEMQWLAKVRRR